MMIELISNFLKYNLKSNNDFKKNSINEKKLDKTYIYNNEKNHNNNIFENILFYINKDLTLCIIFFIIFILILTTINLGILIISLNSNKNVLKLLKNTNC